MCTCTCPYTFSYTCPYKFSCARHADERTLSRRGSSVDELRQHRGKVGGIGIKLPISLLKLNEYQLTDLLRRQILGHPETGRSTSVCSQSKVSAKLMHSQCTVSAQSVHCVSRTVSAQSVHGQCTVGAQCQSDSQCTASAQSVHGQCTVSARSVHGQCAVREQSTQVCAKSAYSQ